MDVNDKQLDVVMDCLMWVRNEVQKPDGERNYREGICGALAFVAGQRHPFFAVDARVLHELFESWPEFSGNISFPVRHPNASPEIGYGKSIDKWAGEYGCRRRRLLDWMIATATTEQMRRHLIVVHPV